MLRMGRFTIAAALCIWTWGCGGSPTTTTSEPEIPEAGRASSAAAEGPSDPDAPEEFTATSTGLKYRILRKGEGDRPTTRDEVTVHYRGWLDDGTEFDSSYKRGEPASFPLGGVIPGWTEGMQLVGEGGKIELEIPGELGYGSRGSPPVIPPDATLHFIVELNKVN